MSNLSGKCDLYDHISMEKMYPKYPDQENSPLVSDIMECFEIFKKNTGGVIYQHHKIKVNEYNHDFIQKKIPQEFETIKHVETVPDKRLKDGTKEKIWYTYKYWHKEYTEKELNKHGVWIPVEIHFDNLLELLPYFPYIISMCSYSDGKEIVYISKQSYVDEQEEDFLQWGMESNANYYRKELADLYREVVLTYFNPEGYEQIDEVLFWKAENNPDLNIDYGELEGKYLGAVQHGPIDENFPIEWIIEKEDKTHWTSPKVVGSRMIEMSPEDFEHFIGPKVKVKYVRQRERKLNLN